jgi:hypothetical protein
MSGDGIKVRSATQTPVSGGTQGVVPGGASGPNAAARNRAAVEAQAMVGMAADAARRVGGDDGLTRSRTPPPPASGTPNPTAPQQTPPPADSPQPGLQVGGVEGFPEGAVKTPGGYVVVPEGKDSAWRIYGPNQSYGDEPLTRVWGDPHVNEKDGTRWDFTKDSNFQLPDGTIIRCDTTSETGASFSQRLDIIAGNDRVVIDGIHSGPKSTTKHQDGDQWMQQNSAALMNSHTFSMRSDGNNVDWFRSSQGKIEGKITGAVKNFDGKGSYTQILDNNPQSAQLDLKKSLGQNGAFGTGGLGFLGVDAESFIQQAMGAFNWLQQQEAAPAPVARPRPRLAR